MGVKLAHADVVVGIYYELPDGRIAYTYGVDGVSKTVTYRFDDDEGGRLVGYAELATWMPRPDLKDFPDARDPRLPYVFDLNWDIKHTSDLKRVLAEGHQDISIIKRAMREYGVRC